MASVSVRLSDYVVSKLADAGLTEVFMVTGGGAMHLNDAFGKNKALRVTCCHHEQACAIAADGYARLTGKPAAVNVTTGPGGTNAITGVYGAWTDSLPMIVVSGNVKWETLVRSTGLPLRQLGDQEADIVAMVTPVTKYAVCVQDPSTIRYHVEKAIHLATTGRPGPVWLDIPMNVQGAPVDPEKLVPFKPEAEPMHWETPDLKAACRQLWEKIVSSRRPAIVAGGGVRVSGAHAEFISFLNQTGIPVGTAWNAHDVLWDDHPSYGGRPGIMGDRAGNFLVQNADLVIALGSRLSIRQVSYDWKNFAPRAFKAMVDVDALELKKPTLKLDLPIHAGLGAFFDCMREVCEEDARFRDYRTSTEWLEWNRERRNKYPVTLPEYWEKRSPVNPYCLIDVLSDCCRPDEVVVCADGTACVVTFQAFKFKEGQRLYHNSGSAPMGYDLPAAIGACRGRDEKPVVCLSGDGSIMMNLQELQTIVTHRLPVKIVLINNLGYHSIRQSQQAHFKESPVGYDAASGVSFPSFAKLAAAFEIPFRSSSSLDDLREKIEETLNLPGPQFLEVMVQPEQPFAPKLASKKLPDGRMFSPPPEDMAPFLSREELQSNMIEDLIKDSEK